MKTSCKVLVAATLFAASANESARSETANAYYKAAVRGSAEAQTNLGALYARGAGVKQSDTAAFQWFLRAAQQGHPKAQVMLSEIWANGRGVPRNDLIAYKWAWLANARATDSATRRHAETLLETLARRLSQAEIVEARRRATDWKPELEVVPKTEDPPAREVVVRDAIPRNERLIGKVTTYRRSALHWVRSLEASASVPPAMARTRSVRRHLPTRFISFARRLGL